jgi:hypothetical protein
MQLAAVAGGWIHGWTEWIQRPAGFCCELLRRMIDVHGSMIDCPELRKSDQ